MWTEDRRIQAKRHPLSFPSIKIKNSIIRDKCVDNIYSHIADTRLTTTWINNKRFSKEDEKHINWKEQKRALNNEQIAGKETTTKATEVKSPTSSSGSGGATPTPPLACLPTMPVVVIPGPPHYTQRVGPAGRAAPSSRVTQLSISTPTGQKLFVTVPKGAAPGTLLELAGMTLRPGRHSHRDHSPGSSSGSRRRARARRRGR